MSLPITETALPIGSPESPLIPDRNYDHVIWRCDSCPATVSFNVCLLPKNERRNAAIEARAKHRIRAHALTHGVY